MTPKETYLGYSKFAVDETPYCAWEVDVQKANVTFLKSIDPRYFDFTATILSQNLDDDDRQQQAALSLRGLYAHAAESFLALLFAAIQAPDYVPGWLHCYWPKDLRLLAEKLALRKGILNKWKIATPSIGNLADLFFGPLPESQQAVVAGFKESWRRVISDYRGSTLTPEYNGIKHGLRVSSGGHSVAMSKRPDSETAPLTSSDFLLWGNSKFGSTFYEREPLDGKRHFRLKRHSQNWSPELLAARTRVLAGSIHNIRDFLLYSNGEDWKTLSYSLPSEELFAKATEEDTNSGGFSFNPVIQRRNIHPFTEDEILSIYRTQREEPAAPPEAGTESV